MFRHEKGPGNHGTRQVYGQTRRVQGNLPIFKDGLDELFIQLGEFISLIRMCPVYDSPSCMNNLSSPSSKIGGFPLNRQVCSYTRRVPWFPDPFSCLNIYGTFLPNNWSIHKKDLVVLTPRLTESQEQLVESILDQHYTIDLNGS